MNSNTLHDSRVSRIIEQALFEDIGLGDVTSDAAVPEEMLGEAVLLAKATGIVAGLEVTAIVFRYVDEGLRMLSSVHDGDHVRPGDLIGTVNGSAKSILKGERVALNFLQRMSGIATLTRQFVDAVKGTGVRITDTRKTVPGLRVLDKLAVTIGGGVNHRFGLDDMMMVKDNHIVAAGGIQPAIERCFAYLQKKELNIPIEVETRSMDDVRKAMACFEAGKFFNRIMLDNFQPDAMREAVKLIAKRVEVEASGEMTLQNVHTVAKTGVDLISVGALTHSVQALDISLELTLRR
ncbi:MAG: carboxylating nicotinate-nucleotide diphosphorylase [Bacteroidota bacterium]